MKKDAFYIVAMVVLVLLLLRQCQDDEPVVKYVDLPPITDTVKVPVPYLVEIPSKPDIRRFERIDTVRINDTIKVIQSIDTMAIIADFVKKRYYNPVLFDNDTLGRLQLDLVVHQNRLDSLAFEFNPKQKEVTKTEEKKLSPFIFGGYGNRGMSIGAGAYLGNFGVSGSFGNEKDYQIGVYYRF